MGVCASKPADPALIEEGIDQSDAPQKGAQGKGGKSAKGPTSPSTMSRAMRRQSTNIGTPAPLRRGIPGPLALIARCGLRPALLMRLHDSFVVNTVVAFDIRLVLLLLYTYETKWALSAVLTIFICYIVRAAPAPSCAGWREVAHERWLRVFGSGFRACLLQSAPVQPKRRWRLPLLASATLTGAAVACRPLKHAATWQMPFRRPARSTMPPTPSLASDDLVLAGQVPRRVARARARRQRGAARRPRTRHR